MPDSVPNSAKTYIRPSKMCRVYRCPNYQTAGGFCEVHQHLVRPTEYNTDRPAAHLRGYDGSWSKCRAAFIRANPICAHCGRAATVAHHIIPLEDGGDRFDWGNLMPLCRAHHERLHGRAR